MCVVFSDAATRELYARSLRGAPAMGGGRGDGQAAPVGRAAKPGRSPARLTRAANIGTLPLKLGALPLKTAKPHG